MSFDYPFGILDLRLLITALVSEIYSFRLPLWYLRFTAFDYPFGILDLRDTKGVIKSRKSKIPKG
jgi:hypothetical protein